VEDVVCTFGPGDRPFEEQHSAVSIGIVVAGTFQYRSALGRDLMTPGSFLLGHSGQCFECGHEHAAGDRCIAFKYAPDAFERLAAEAGAPRGQRRLRTPRLPPVRELSALVARVASAAVASREEPWEELALRVAGAAIRVATGLRYDRTAATARALARVSESIRTIERDPGARWTLSRLAANARLSPFYYLRTFQQVTGVTPHQFILRARLREAATRLIRDQAKVIDIALDAGFGDISNFNRSFRAEFGAAPEAYRRTVRR
jgi:AraC-like DNA-binding protein